MSQSKITQAFIFAAGRGERMRPLTDSLPKPLVKIKNKAILDYTIEKLDRISSIKKIIVNGFYLAEQVKEHLQKLNNPKIIFSHESEKIETGGGLVFAKDKIDFDQPIITCNGDVLWEENSIKSDIETLVEAWESSNCDILLGLKKKEEYLGYEGSGDFNFDEKTGSLQRLQGSKMDYVFVGLQIINPKILNSPRDISSEKCFSMSHFYKPNSDGTMQHKVKGVELSGKYFHIGTIDAIAATELKLT